jgi:plasmid stabilization system protein ParE
MSSYVLGSDVLEDLLDIWRYIAEDSETAADRWLERLYDEFEILAARPGMGHSRGDLTARDVLFWPVSGLSRSLSCQTATD